MKLRKKQYTLAMLLILTVAGCISEFTADLPTNQTGYLIIDGSIISDTTVQFNISKTIPLSQKPTDEDKEVQAKLYVVGSDGYKSEEAGYVGKGVHQVTIKRLNEQTLYHIEVEYEGETYQSEPAKPLFTAPIDELSWNQPAEKKNVTLHLSTHDDRSEPQYYLWNYTEDWEIRSEQLPDIFFSPSDNSYYTNTSAPYYYCWKKHKSQEILVGSTEALTENRIVNRKLYEREASFDYFTETYCTTITQMAVSKAAYEYYLNKIKLNNEMGGLFTPQPFELESNITCTTNPNKQVVGFINVAMNATAKRIFILPKEVSIVRDTRDCGLYSIAELIEKFFQSTSNVITEAVLYEAEFRPVTGDPVQGYYWAKSLCTDCRAREGSKTKPKFWPNDHK